MDAVAAKSYSEQYEQMLREQLKQALDSIDRQEQAQVNRYDTELARVEAARQDALRGAYADYAHNINPYGIQAESAYAQNKATFEMEKGSASTSFTGSGKNFHVYSQKSDGWFSYVCQVERTFLYARVPAEHQDTVEEAAKALGY